MIFMFYFMLMKKKIFVNLFVFPLFCFGWLSAFKLIQIFSLSLNEINT